VCQKEGTVLCFNVTDFLGVNHTFQYFEWKHKVTTKVILLKNLWLD